MSIQDDIVTIGLNTTRAITGKTIIYHRGTDDAETILALPGRMTADRLAGEVVVGSAELVDWLFPAVELAGEPLAADWLEWEGDRYDLADVPGVRAWGWVDPAHTWLRVHTVKTGAAPTTTTTAPTATTTAPTTTTTGE